MHYAKYKNFMISSCARAAQFSQLPVLLLEGPKETRKRDAVKDCVGETLPTERLKNISPIPRPKEGLLAFRCCQALIMKPNPKNNIQPY